MKRQALKLRAVVNTEGKSSFFIVVIFIVICILFGNAFLGSDKAIAEGFPEKNITCIVPFAVGGQGDLMVRSIAPLVEERMGVSIQIENVPGVPKIGVTKLWKSKPDGYTIGHFPFPSSVIAELTSKVEFKCTEFTHIYAWNISNLILQVHPNGPKNVSEFLQLAKTKPLAGSTGAFGSATHLAAVVMAKGMGIDVRWVHYSSGGEANVVLAGGHVDFNAVSMSPQTVALARAGKLRLLMIVGNEKDSAFPDIPIHKDFGYSFKSFPLAHGVAGPKNIPADRVSRLENAFADAAKDVRFKKLADDNKFQIVHFSGKAYGQMIAEGYSELEKFKELLVSK